MAEETATKTDETLRKILAEKINRRKAIGRGAAIAIGVGAAVVAGGGVAAYYSSLTPTVQTSTATSTATTTAVSTATSTATSTAISTSVQTTTATQTVTTTATQTSSSTTSAGPTYGGTWRGTWGNLGDADHLNPLISLNNVGGATFDLAYSTLLVADENFQPIPWAAKSYDVSVDLKTYTFHLVQNSTWHDGQPFTSKDVKFTFDYAIGHNLGTYSIFKSEISRVDAPDDYTVVFNLNDPDAAFPAKFTAYNAWIVPEHIWTNISDPATFTNDGSTVPIIGNGPFQVVKWVKGQYIQFKKNPKFWDPTLPYLDGLIINTYNTQDDLFLAFQSGNIDFALLDPTEVPSVLGRTDVTVDKFELQGNNVLCFNYARGVPYTDKQFRIAVAHSMDKQTMLKTAFDGYGVIDEHQMSFIFESQGFTSDKITVYEFDPQKAMSVLDAAGYKVGSDGWRTLPDGTPYKPALTATIFNGGNITLAKLQASNMQAVGLNVQLNILDNTTAFNNLFGGNFELFSLPYYGTYNTDPETWLRDLWETDNPQNFCKYSNPQLDALFKSQHVEPDSNKRKAIFQQIDELMSVELPNVRMPFWVQPFVMSNMFKGWKIVRGLGPISDKGTTTGLVGMYKVQST